MVMTLADSKPRPKPYRALGRRVAQLRKQAGLTQWELADAVHISRGYPPLIESGQNRPDPAILRKIAALLGVTYTELAALAGYADADADLDSDGEVMPVRPGYRGVLARLQEVFTPAQLTSLEKLYQELFTETVTVRRHAEQVPQDAGDAECSERAPEEDADDTDLCG